MNEKQMREIIRDEIIRAARIWQDECQTMGHAMIDRHGICYGMQPATTNEKIDRFIECMSNYL